MRLLAYLLRARGLSRLRHGFCPACYSSPPRPECPLCEGEVRYGHELAPLTATLWRTRWDAYCEAIR